MGYKVKREDVVKYDGRKILPEPYVYILMNKPKDFITTASDDKGRKTVMDIIKTATTERVYPVGRLDRNTTGVMLLTNDGEFKRQLELPASGVERTYRARAFGDISQAQLEELAMGIEIDGVDLQPCGGTHVARTGEIGRVLVKKIESKGARNKRVVIALVD